MISFSSCSVDLVGGWPCYDQRQPWRRGRGETLSCSSPCNPQRATATATRDNTLATAECPPRPPHRQIKASREQSCRCFVALTQARLTHYTDFRSYTKPEDTSNTITIPTRALSACSLESWTTTPPVFSWPIANLARKLPIVAVASTSPCSLNSRCCRSALQASCC